jgi:Tat protein translocase TatB subunit
MDFLGLGEILLIALVILLIWGPDKLPELMRTLGRVTSYLKKASAELTTQIKRELEEEKKEVKEQEKVETVPESPESATSEPEIPGQETSPGEEI